jgi:hypothetical protein
MKYLFGMSLLVMMVSGHTNLANQYDKNVIYFSQRSLINALKNFPINYDSANPITSQFTPTAWQQLEAIVNKYPSIAKIIAINEKKCMIINKGIFIRRFFWLVKIPVERDSKQKPPSDNLTLYVKVVNAVGRLNEMGFIIQSLSLREDST